MKLLKIIVAVILVCAGLTSARANGIIVIIRHGEKPANGLGQLSCKGLNRSLALPSMLLARYGKPVAIYAPNPSIPKKDKGVFYSYVRPLATIEPLAIRTGLPVDIEFGMTEITPLSAKLLAATEGTQIIAWEHHWGEQLARHLFSRLGGDPDVVPEWQDSDFDSVYVIRTAHGTNPARPTFSREQEGLNGLEQSCEESLTAGGRPFRE